MTTCEEGSEHESSLRSISIQSCLTAECTARRRPWVADIIRSEAFPAKLGGENILSSRTELND